MEKYADVQEELHQHLLEIVMPDPDTVDERAQENQRARLAELEQLDEKYQ